MPVPLLRMFPSLFCFRKMRSKHVQNVIAGIAVFLSLLMLYSAFKGWSTREVVILTPKQSVNEAQLVQQQQQAVPQEELLRAQQLQKQKKQHPKATAGNGADAAPTATSAVAATASAAAETANSQEAKVAAAAAAARAAADPLPSVKPSALGKPYYVYPEARTNTSVAVTIVIVVTVGTRMEAFATALNSVQCYAALHNYTVSLEFDDKFKECAVHKDKFFRRHCHTLKLMQTQIKEDDWALFIDGDVGVVNPKRLIEEYLEDGYEIYLFDRFYNWEYAALSYLVKNNKRGRSWVEEFSQFEFKLPQSFHGTDNGALHPFLMHYLVPETRDPKTRSRTAVLCLDLWKRSDGYEALFGMQACTRMVIGERTHFPEHKVKIYQKGDGWAHDLWIFHSHWATDDFMMHSLKEENFKPFPSDDAGQQRCRDALLNLEGNGECHVVFPVLKKLNVENCRAGTEGWLMEGRLQIDNETRKRIYDKMAYRILKQQMELVGKTAAKIENI